jgi:hydroxyacylglutathione hydrolase
VLLTQFLDDDLGCASYLVGDVEAGEAALIDPVYAVEELLGEADRHGLRIQHVLETHTHADHVSGHGRLALDHGIPVSVHREARVAYPHEPLEDGDEIAVGSLTVRTLHTPGHRPEHCCFLVGDALLTGDSLFVGAAARPDLAVEARTGAEGLFHSLHRLLELPDDVRVMPGHVAGSLCGSNMSAERSSTIGHERRFNPALALATVEEFVSESASVTVPRPPNMEHIVELNRGPFLGSPRPIAPTERDGYFELDVRDFETYAAGHEPGAINVPVSGTSFGTKAGFLVPHGRTVALRASSPGQAEIAAARLYAVGFFEIAGYIEEDNGQETLEPIGLDELDRLRAGGAIELIDVREAYEWEAGFIPGSSNVPYRVVAMYAGELPRDRTIVTICETGPRAAIAASVLSAHGVPARPVSATGIDEWVRLGGDVSRIGNRPS